MPGLDLSDDNGNSDVERIAKLTLDSLSEQKTRRLFRTLAVVAALAVLMALVGSLLGVVWTFTSEFRSLASGSHVLLAGAAPAAPAGSTVLPAAPAGAAGHAPGASAPAEAGSVLVPLASFTTSLVAMVTAFVIAATVLAIALVRASFTLSARGDDPRPAPDPAAAEGNLVLPSVELVKSVGEAIQTAARGLVADSRKD